MAGHYRKILIADTSETFIAYITLLLRKMGFARTIIADSGEEALKLIKLWPPDIAILGAEMPGLDGLATLRALRANPETAALPVIIVAEARDRKVARACKTLGCGGVLVKPVKIGVLNKALQDCINATGGARRVHLRIFFEGLVSVTHKGGTETLKAVTLSEGGMFLRTSTPRVLGTELTVEFFLGDLTIKTTGTVIYHKAGTDTASPLKEGMALQFRRLTKEQQAALKHYIVNILKRHPDRSA